MGRLSAGGQRIDEPCARPARLADHVQHRLDLAILHSSQDGRIAACQEAAHGVKACEFEPGAAESLVQQVGIF